MCSPNTWEVILAPKRKVQKRSAYAVRTPESCSCGTKQDSHSAFGLALDKSVVPDDWFVPTEIGNRTESTQDADSVLEFKRDTDNVTAEFFPPRGNNFP